jgi:hypothetical protein
MVKLGFEFFKLNFINKLILPAALGFGFYSASNRNKNTFLGNRVRPVREADSS